MDLERWAEDFANGGDGTVAEIKRVADELRAKELFRPIAPMLIEAGRRALYGKGDRADWERPQWAELADLLCDHLQFGYARKLLGRLRRDPGDDSEALRQQQAFATYRDQGLPAARRLERALEVLGDLSASTSARSLGLAGAIYKRRWDLEAKHADLESSLWCYERGYAQSGDPERHRAGIDAAFVADQLAALVRGEAGPEQEKARLRARADQIRTEIVAAPPDSGRDRADETMGEALLGLGRVEDACARLRAAHESTPDLWRLEATAMQIAALSELRGIAETDARAALEALLGQPGDALRRGRSGKLGLALSGGGFRASLFHIGVLARLAESDVLRRVEVLSCVSGGSIIGAFYYLKLRRLLEEKADSELSRDDYVALVLDVAADFLDAVHEDLRGHLLTNLVDDLRMAFSRYSRTNRVAELLEKSFYSRIEKDGPWRMTDLFVTPKGSGEGFSLSYENWLREAKVPVLVLNSTTLNTGHNWQFTASWMGESPADVDEEVDATRRLRRVYYRDAPGAHGEPALAEAVAASAAVPMLFPPIRLTGLYKGIDVELVDGGVHDNQGIASLIDQECSAILVSDASGQSPEDEHPKRRFDQVAKRSNSILMARVRGSQFGEVTDRLRAGSLRGLMVVHLKKRLPAPPRDWIGCQEPYERADDALPDVSGRPPYGIDVKVQRALAELRTDLDDFSDAEALSLMAAGYAMTRCELPLALPDAECAKSPPWEEPEGWPFLAALAEIGRPAKETGLAKTLRLGHWLFFRRLHAWWHDLRKGSGEEG
ncbi:MAG TPA: patatin-like phospholipase family protein [Solirubrobacterales bacterium]|nr:patatin-like phospholipase family protein [Solirubrobacterales bacterium]